VPLVVMVVVVVVVHPAVCLPRVRCLSRARLGGVAPLRPLPLPFSASPRDRFATRERRVPLTVTRSLSLSLSFSLSLSLSLSLSFSLRISTYLLLVPNVDVTEEALPRQPRAASTLKKENRIPLDVKSNSSSLISSRSRRIST